MEARNRQVREWFGLVEKGHIMLPRFQRFEAWGHHNVTGLLDTVLEGLPAGAVLVLQVAGKAPFVSRPVAGAPEGTGPVNELLLDGQQRLTALWRALSGDYPDRSYYVSMEPDEETGRERYAYSRARWAKNGARYPLYLNDPAEVWGRKLIPTEILTPTSEVEANRWVEAATTGDDGEPDYRAAMELQKHVGDLRRQFAHFNLPFLALPASTSSETALDVFIKMNTSATPLSTYDIVVAQVEANVGRSLHDLASELKESAPHVEAYGSTENLMLSAAALLQDRTTNRTSFLAGGFADRLVEDWPTILKGMRRAVSFLEDERIYDGRRLPTDVVLPPLVALWGESPDGLDAEGTARSVLRRYLWRACFTERYERASNSRVAADYRALRSRIAGGDAAPEIFDEEEWPLPGPDVFLEAAWPTRKSTLARAVLALSLRHGGDDLADGAPVRRDNLDAREYHHLFPKAYLEARGAEDADRALNCALVTWKTNRTIAAKAPSDYVHDRLEATRLGEAEIRRRLDANLIPYDALMGDDYGDFLIARAEMMEGPMRKLCSDGGTPHGNGVPS